MLNVKYQEDTRPIQAITLVQPKGTLDLVLTKNAKGNRIRISNAYGNVVNVDTSKLAYFVEALTKISTKGAKSSKKAA